jgi:hypothetical protein
MLWMCTVELTDWGVAVPSWAVKDQVITTVYFSSPHQLNLVKYFASQLASRLCILEPFTLRLTNQSPNL